MLETRQAATSAATRPPKALPFGANYSQTTTLNQLYLQDVDEVLKNAGLSRQDLLKLTYDSEIYGCLERRVSAVIATQYTISTAAPKAAPKNDDRLMLALQTLLARLHEPLVRSVMMGKWLGLAFTELVYQAEEGGGVTISEVIPRPQSSFTREKINGKALWLFNSPLGEKIPIIEGKLLINGVNVHEDNPFGDALLSRVYWAWFFKKAGLQFWAKFAERHASPLTVGKTNLNTLNPQDASLQLAQMAASLSSAVAAGTIAIDNSDTVEFIEASGDGSAHKLFVTEQNKVIQKTLLGRVLTSELDNSSRAAQETDEQFVTDIYESDLAFCQSALNELVANYCRANQMVVAEVKIEYQPKQVVDKSRYERDIALMQTGQIKFSADYFKRYHGLADDEFELIPTTPHHQTQSLSLAAKLADEIPSTPATREQDKRFAAYFRKTMPSIDAPVLAGLQSSQNEWELKQKLQQHYLASTANAEEEETARDEIFDWLMWDMAQGLCDGIDGRL